jgi:hypothetical protein
MKQQPAKGRTAKHAGGTKHHAGHKHHPSHITKEGRQDIAQADHARAVARQRGQAKPAKYSPLYELSCCAYQAVAQTLRLAEYQVTERYVARLVAHESGATIPEALEAFGLEAPLGLILVFYDLWPEAHAVVPDGPGYWSWGEWYPGLLPVADEMWSPR